MYKRFRFYKKILQKNKTDFKKTNGHSINCPFSGLPKQDCRTKKKKKTTKKRYSTGKIIHIQYFTVIPFLLAFLRNHCTCN